MELVFVESTEEESTISIGGSCSSIKDATGSSETYTWSMIVFDHEIQRFSNWQVSIEKRISIMDEEWEQKRKQLVLEGFGCSSFPIWFNYGYESLKSYLSKKEKKPFNSFVQRAIDHGNNNEYPALMFYRTNFDPSIKKSLYTISYRISCPEYGCFMVTGSIDAFCSNEQDCETTTNKIVEIKCPINQRHVHISTEDWMLAFVKKYPDGHPSSFIQALLYASVSEDVNFIDTVHYFQGHEDGDIGMIVYSYIVGKEAKHYALKEAAKFSAKIKDLNLPAKTKIETKTKRQQTVYKIMKSLKIGGIRSKLVRNISSDSEEKEVV